MPQVAREFDTCDHGGAPIGQDGKGIDSTVFVNSRAVAVSDGIGDGATGPCGLWQDNLTPAGDGFDTHPLGRSPLYPAGSNPPGIPGPTTGSDTVFVGGLPIHRFNDDRGCGAETITASPDVWADFVAKIRIEGATVNNPKPSPAAITSWGYSPITFFQFTSVNPGMFYVIKNSSKNKLFRLLNFYDFEEWGTSITATLEFEEVTDADKFKVPDIDLAVRTLPFPLVDPFGVPNTNNPAITASFGGLIAKGFPSFGEIRDLSGFGRISGLGTTESWQDFFAPSYDNPEFPLLVTGLTGTGFKGYPFKVANESGSMTSYLKLINIPTVPFSNFLF